MSRKAISLQEAQKLINKIIDREANPYKCQHHNDRSMIAEEIVSVVAIYLNEEHEWGGRVALMEVATKYVIHNSYMEGIADANTINGEPNE